jgi:hypothetical protein
MLFHHEVLSVVRREAMRNTAFIRLRVRTTLVSMSFLTAVSCTAYTPIRRVETAPGSNVRVRLSYKGAVDLAPKIGPRARQLEGAVKQATDSSLVIAVRRVVRDDAGEDTYDGLEVSIPPQDIETAEVSKTSVSRSILAAGAIIATAFLVAKGASDISGGSGNRPPPVGQ